MPTVYLTQSSFGGGIPALSDNTTYVLSENIILSGRFPSVGSNVEFDGSNHTITITNVTGYLGLFPSRITVSNLGVLSNNSTLAISAGWLFQQGSSGTATNCYSTGDISNLGGGIFGENAGLNDSTGAIATDCYSIGNIGTEAGGIFGKSAGQNGKATATRCYSTGSIGYIAGGIFGSQSGISGGEATAANCFSAGQIGVLNPVGGAGGIFGAFSAYGANSIARATNCFSCGTIKILGGGIFGMYSTRSSSPSDNGTCYAQNCYSIGNIENGAGGIYGGYSGIAGTLVAGAIYVTNCYVSGTVPSTQQYFVGVPSAHTVITNSGYSLRWSNTVANTYLQTSGIWYSTGTNIPYTFGTTQPTLSIQSATATGTSTANLSGTVTSSTDPIRQSGFVASESTRPLYSDNITVATTGVSFPYSVTGTTSSLTPRTDYNASVYVITKLGVFYASTTVSFTTFALTTIYLTQANISANLNLDSYTPYILNENITMVVPFTSVGTRTSLDGNGRQITITSPTFIGLFPSYITVQNLGIISQSTLLIGNGWFFQSGVGGTATNCYSTGSIPSNGGGIFGNCPGGSTATGCYSIGTIGSNGGGIYGSSAGSTGSGTITAIGCFSLGTISFGAGGIFGAFSGTTCPIEAEDCYTWGSVQSFGGGIYGIHTATNAERTIGGTASATNCYTLGNISQNAGGIFGYASGLTGVGGISVTNCYVAGIPTSAGSEFFAPGCQNTTATNSGSSRGWVTASANIYLSLSNVWYQWYANQPYRLGATSVVLTTSNVTGITEATATSGGNITNDNGESITARGVCWNTTFNALLDNQVSSGSGTGLFSVSATPLTPNTNYYLRAWALNKYGVSFGNNKQFQTNPATPIYVTNDTFPTSLLSNRIYVLQEDCTVSTSITSVGTNIVFDGNNKSITVNGVSTGYQGLFKPSSSGYTMRVNNLAVHTRNSTLAANAGWIFGGSCTSGATIQIINCYTSGLISSSGGGLIGSYSGTNGGSITITNCYSTGDISTGGGGIVGAYSTDNTGRIVISNCYTTGTINQDAGGMVGKESGKNNGSIIVRNSFVCGRRLFGGFQFFGINSVNTQLISSGYNESGWVDTEANRYLIGYPSSTTKVWYSWYTGQRYRLIPLIEYNKASSESATVWDAYIPPNTQTFYPTFTWKSELTASVDISGSPSIIQGSDGSIFFAVSTKGTFGTLTENYSAYGISLGCYTANGTLKWLFRDPSLYSGANDVQPSLALGLSGELYLTYVTYGNIPGRWNMTDVVNLCGTCGNLRGTKDIVLARIDGAVSGTPSVTWRIQDANLNSCSDEEFPQVLFDKYNPRILLTYQCIGRTLCSTRIGTPNIVVSCHSPEKGVRIWTYQDDTLNSTGMNKTPSITYDKQGYIYIAYVINTPVKGGAPQLVLTEDIEVVKIHAEKSFENFGAFAVRDWILSSKTQINIKNIYDDTIQYNSIPYIQYNPADNSLYVSFSNTNSADYFISLCLQLDGTLLWMRISDQYTFDAYNSIKMSSIKIAFNPTGTVLYHVISSNALYNPAIGNISLFRHTTKISNDFISNSQWIYLYNTNFATYYSPSFTNNQLPIPVYEENHRFSNTVISMVDPDKLMVSTVRDSSVFTIMSFYPSQRYTFPTTGTIPINYTAVKAPVGTYWDHVYQSINPNSGNREDSFAITAVEMKNDVQYAAQLNGPIMSAYGDTWIPCYSRIWTGITCTVSGQYSVITSTNGYLLYSSNYGTTWTEIPNAGRRKWTSCVMNSSSIIASYDKGIVIGSIANPLIWTNVVQTYDSVDISRISSLCISTDYVYAASQYSGSVFRASLSLSDLNSWSVFRDSSNEWTHIAVSSDGTLLVGTDAESVFVYNSSSTEDWTSIRPGNYSSIACATNGSTNYAVISETSGYIWVYQKNGTTLVNKSFSIGSRYWSSVRFNMNATIIIATEASGTVWIGKATMPTSDFTWTAQTTQRSRKWKYMCGSSDISKLILLENVGSIWTGSITDTTSVNTTSLALTNATTTLFSKDWADIAAAVDGSILVACVRNGSIWLSTNGGLQWSEQSLAGTRDWISIVMSWRGDYILAAARSGTQFGTLWLSTDDGASWSQRPTPNNDWRCVSISYNGRYMVAAVYQGSIWISTDYGSSWRERYNDTNNRKWISVRSSLTGLYVYAVEENGSIWKSSNYGSNWSVVFISTDRLWTSVNCSWDGSNIIACTKSNGTTDLGSVYISTDFGLSWINDSRGGTENWVDVVSSTNASTLVIASQNHVWNITNTEEDCIHIDITIDISVTRNINLIVYGVGTVDWGDNQTNSFSTQISNPLGNMSEYSQNLITLTHSYLLSGEYTILLKGYVSYLDCSRQSSQPVTHQPITNITMKNRTIFHLICQNVTSLQSIQFPDSSPIVIVNITNCPNIASLQLNNCSDLEVLSVSGCMGLTNISINSCNFTYTTLMSIASSLYVAGSGKQWSFYGNPGSEQLFISFGTIPWSTLTGWTLHYRIPGDLLWNPQINVSGSPAFKNVYTINTTNPTFRYVLAVAGNTTYFLRDEIIIATTGIGATTSTSLTLCCMNSSYAIVSAYNGKLYRETTPLSSSSTWATEIDTTARNRTAIAISSASSNTIAFTVQNGQIFVSTNNGQSWTARESFLNWSGIAMSDDGTKIAACVKGGLIFTSANQGVSWASNGLSKQWIAICISDDGTILMAAEENGYIYVSSDSGNSWSSTSHSESWTSLSMSSDGSRITATTSNDYIYMSTDYGTTWIPQQSQTKQNYTSTSISRNGSIVAAVTQNGTIYTSNV